MALSITSIGNFLFKKNQGKSSTNDGRQFFEEPIDGRAAVFPVQVWAQGDVIPSTAPALADQAVSGVVKKYVQLQLTAVAGTSNAFFHANLKDCIPFNFASDGSYNYQLFDSGGASIPFGQGDWIVDPAVGTVTFYGTTPGNMPPKITFFQYVGTKGLSATSGPATSQAFAEQTSDPAAPAAGIDLLYFKAGPTLYAINSAGVIRQIATLTGTETLTNKTLTAPVANFVSFTNQAPPATPASGSTVIFAGTGNALMQIDSTGTVKQLGTLTGTETFTNKTLTGPIIDIARMTDQSSTPTTPAAGTTLIYTQNKRVFMVDSNGVALQLASLTGTETLVSKTLTKPIIDVVQYTDQSADPAQPAAGTTLIYTKNKRAFLFDSTTAPQSVPIQLASLSGTETLTNKTLTGPITDVTSYTDQSTSPSTPASGTTLIYSKSGLFYKKSGADGLETLLGSGGSGGGGAGGKNYFQSLYDGTAITNITRFNALPAVVASRPDLTYTSNYITPASYHAIGTGMAVVYTTTGTAMGGLTSGSTYYAIRMGGQAGGGNVNLQFAATLADALARRPITLTAPGSTNGQTFTPVASQANAAYVFGSFTNLNDGSPTGITTATNTSTPLRPTSSQRFTQDANNRLLSGWSIDFTVDPADYLPNQLMKFSFTYQTSANYAGDVLVGIEDTFNAYPVQVNGNFADPLPSAPSISRYNGYFNLVSNSSTYRVTFTIQTTAALGWTIDFNDIAVTNASGSVPGAFSTALTQVANPVVTAINSPPTRPTSGVTESYVMGRIGDSARIMWSYSSTVSTGSASGSGDYLFGLPAGLQFDPSKVTFNTATWNPNVPLINGGLGSAQISDGASYGVGQVYPYDLNRFRVILNYNNIQPAYGRLSISSANFFFGQTSTQKFSFDFIAPILNWSASATYSTNEIALKNTPTFAVSTPYTNAASGSWLPMVGNSLNLAVGTWDLTSLIDFGSTGTSPGYSNMAHGWFAANGNNSSTLPALLTTIPGATVYGPNAVTNYMNEPVNNLSFRSSVGMNCTIKLTQPATVYYCAAGTGSAMGNSKITATLIANKRPDYSAFGVYGQFDLRTTTSPTITGVNGQWAVMTNNSLTLPVGTWRLKHAPQYDTNGSSPGYTQFLYGIFAANGTGSTTVPAALSTLTNVLVLSAQPPYAQVGVLASQNNSPAQYDVIIRVTTGTATVFSVMYAAVGTAANSKFTSNLNAERLQ